MNNMKIFCLLGTGRSGVDFLQTLFDQHPEVSHLPGVFYYQEFWSKLKKKNPSQIIKKFIKNHERFFNSKTYKDERHDRLGKNKNENFFIKKKLFSKYFTKLCKDPNNKLEVFINLHLAYSAASGENIKKKRAILVNVHSIEHFEGLKGFNYEIILNMRHPICSLNSSINHWLAFSKKNVDLWWLNFQINRLVNLIDDCVKLKKKTYIVRLDLLHTQNIKLVRRLLKVMDLKYDECLNHSTYHGKIWWGDKLSIKYLNGFNKDFKDKYSKANFYQKDIAYFNNLFNFYYYNYKYKKIKSDPFKKFYKFLPIKLELIVWKNLLVNFNILQIFLIPYYWFKRIKITKIKNKKQLNKYPKLI